MKNHILFAIAFLMPVLASCDIFPDDRNNFLPAEQVYLNMSEVRVNVFASDSSYTISVIKSGKGQSEADVFLSIDSDGLDEYNEVHGTSFKLVPDNILQGFSEESFHFQAGDARKLVKLSWDADALEAYLTLGKYAIPIRMTANGLDVVKDKDFLLLIPKAE